MSRAENALMRLYEDADLRDELTDDEADQMLKWAESELTRLDASGVDDSAFEAQVDTLLNMLKKINRFAGRQGQFSAQSNDQAPANIAALAAELGHPASAEQVAAAGTGDPSGTLTALIHLMSFTPAASQAAPPALPETPLAEVSSDQAEQLESAPVAPKLDEASPAPDQPDHAETAPSPDQPSTDSPDIPFGAYVDEYDL